MASAAIPMLVGTGISLLGAKAGWDPRLTALASMAGGGIAGGMASGAFGSAAGTAAGAGPGVGMTGSLLPTGASTATLGGITAPSTSGVMFGSSAPGATGMFGTQSITPSILPSSATTMAGTTLPRHLQNLGFTGLGYTAPSLVHSPEFLSSGQWNPGINPSVQPGFFGSAASQPTFGGAQSGFSKWITGPQGKALGADMLKTFLDYEIALANEPPQRLSSGGGGGGGGGRAPAYPGGGQTGQKSVVWSYPQATGMYQPKPLA